MSPWLVYEVLGITPKRIFLWSKDFSVSHSLFFAPSVAYSGNILSSVVEEAECLLSESSQSRKDGRTNNNSIRALYTKRGYTRQTGLT